VTTLGSGDAAVDEMEEAEGHEASPTTDLPEIYRHLDERERAQKLSMRRLFAEQELGLRQKYADSILWLLAVQLVIADAVFVAFAWAGRRWDLPPGVVEVWLAGTVVGVVAVVTRHLFPGREVGA
jgi:hypothetical protein